MTKKSFFFEKITKNLMKKPFTKKLCAQMCELSDSNKASHSFYKATSP